MAATADALLRDHPPTRPGLRLVPDRAVPGRRRPAGSGRRGAGSRRAAGRRRLLAVVAVMAFGLGLLVASVQPGTGRGAVDGDGGAQASAVEPTTVVVAPGDTVWDLARRHLPPGREPGAYVREILATNEVQPTALEPGTVLRLPPP